MKVALPRRLFRPVFSIVVLGSLSALLLSVPRAVAAPLPSHTTLVIFPDHSLPQGEWPALFAALHSTLADGMPETRVLDPAPELLRGDLFVPGTLVESPIMVFLHGDCTLQPQPLPSRYGAALGWVRELHGVIQPFVDVDCTRIARVLGLRAAEMTRNQCVSAMAEALSRVIVHEWIHIATQNPKHAREGVAKASFTASDLLGGRPIRPDRAPDLAKSFSAQPPGNIQAALVKTAPPE